jgi:hypothetical protein
LQCFSFSWIGSEGVFGNPPEDFTCEGDVC